MQFSISDAVDATGAWVAANGPHSEFDGASQDSRQMGDGALFIPVSGLRDGHDFIADAVANGAAAYLTTGRVIDGPAVALVVDNPEAALVDLARIARRRIGGVVAITGSAGKTTSKDMVAHMFATTFEIGVAPGSHNNEIGMPLTLVNAPDGADWVIAEIGARHVGDVSWGARILEPTIGVVTNVGLAHVGIFESEDAIAATKGELIEALPATGTAVLNASDERVLAMSDLTDARVLTFCGPDADVRARGLQIDADLCARFDLVTPDGRVSTMLPASGEHIVECALAAAAASYAAGVDIEAMAEAIASAPRPNHRMNILRADGGWRIVDDAYNANPASMAAALENSVNLVTGNGRAIALLGTMNELGALSEQCHHDVAELAANLGYELVVGVGDYAECLADHVEHDPVAAAHALRESVGGFRPGDMILVKASRAVELEQAIPLLMRDQ